jgi:L-amino acid N-acyltransferase YncA
VDADHPSRDARRPARPPRDLQRRGRDVDGRLQSRADDPRRAAQPALVADVDGAVAGFASFAEFRGAWHGYRFSVEHSVHVAAAHRGRGLGPQLVEALFEPARAMGKHVMIGGIEASNAGSLRMHERLGFERVAHFREVGHKFGRWLDLVFVQRFLDAPGTVRER